MMDIYTKIMSWISEFSSTHFELMALPLFIALGAIFWLLIQRFVVNPSITSFLRPLKRKNARFLMEQILQKNLHTVSSILMVVVIESLLIHYLFKGQTFVHVGLNAAITILGTIFILRSMDVFHDYHDQKPKNAKRPITHYIQALKILIYFLSIIGFLGSVSGVSFSVILGSMGATSAVILLVFQDAILGLVGGITLLKNGLLQRGDWVSIPQHNANGIVQDVNLISIQVKNFDGVFVTVPVSQLIKQSFQNNKGILETGLRRIQRPFYIVPNSVRFLTKKDWQGLLKNKDIKTHLQQKYDSIKNKPEELNRYTNLTAFRHYIDSSLRAQSLVSSESGIFIRQLAMNERGLLPVEVAVFLKDWNPSVFDAFQSEFFENIFATTPLFSLKLHSPSMLSDEFLLNTQNEEKSS